MKTGNNIATNNYIVRIWSSKHYNRDWIWDGTIQNVQTKEDKHFHSVGQMLSIMEKWDKHIEKKR